MALCTDPNSATGFRICSDAEAEVERLQAIRDAGLEDDPRPQAEQSRRVHVANLPEGVVDRDDRTGQWFLNGLEIDPAISSFRDVIDRAIAQGETADTGPSSSALLASADRARALAQDAFQFDQTFQHEVAQAEELMAFNRAKERLAVEEGNEDRALRARDLIASIQARIDDANFRRQQLRIDTAAEIGRLAQNPADIGQLAGFLRAGRTVRDLISSGDTAITDESLAPTQELLQTQRDLEAPLEQRAPAFEELFQPIDPNEFLAGAETPVADPAEPAGPLAAVGASPPPGRVMTPEELFGDQVVLAADGGTTHARNVLVGEEGPELLMKNRDGSITIIPNDQLETAQDGGTFNLLDGRFDPLRTAAPPGSPADFTQNPGGLPGSGATGLPPGSVVDPEGNVTGPEPAAPVTIQDAREFIAGTGQDALRLGGFSSAADVSPIKVAAPGTPRFLRDVSASTSAALGFGPQDLFLEEVLRLIPQAVTSRVTRRTR